MHTGKRILIVDDLKTMTAIVFQILKDANYTDIDRVHDGASALAALVKRNTILSLPTGKCSQSAERSLQS